MSETQSFQFGGVSTLPPVNPPFVGINGEITGLGFANRDYGAKSEEDQGILEFATIKNDGKIENMKLLIDLKNIFARQLPKMPKEYISKLVFDRNHESLVILKNKNKIIGGICYRRYPSQKFAEIAFLAVSAAEQVRGYGTRLMNKYKDKMQEEGMEFLLTYADNYAIGIIEKKKLWQGGQGGGYFKKQGFSKEHKMPADRWKGFIKDYDGGTFMECIIHPSIDYCNISNIIKEQKQFIIEQVKNLCINAQRYPGLSFEHANREKTETNTLLKIDEIPGIVASGWLMEDFTELTKSKERSFHLQCMNVVETMRKHKSSWPFLEPVNKDEVVDYYDIITDPIDIKTVEKKLQSNHYPEKEKFISDVRRIFTNARFYNQPETIYYKCANELESYINPYLISLKDNVSGSVEEEVTRGKIPGVKKKIMKTKMQ